MDGFIEGHDYHYRGHIITIHTRFDEVRKVWNAQSTIIKSLFDKTEVLPESHQCEASTKEEAVAGCKIQSGAYIDSMLSKE